MFEHHPDAAHFRYPYVYGPHQLVPREWCDRAAHPRRPRAASSSPTTGSRCTTTATPRTSPHAVAARRSTTPTAAAGHGLQRRRRGGAHRPPGGRARAPPRSATSSRSSRCRTSSPSRPGRCSPSRCRRTGCSTSRRLTPRPRLPRRRAGPRGGRRSPPAGWPTTRSSPARMEETRAHRPVRLRRRGRADRRVGRGARPRSSGRRAVRRRARLRPRVQRPRRAARAATQEFEHERGPSRRPVRSPACGSSTCRSRSPARTRPRCSPTRAPTSSRSSGRASATSPAGSASAVNGIERAVPRVQPRASGRSRSTSHTDEGREHRAARSRRDADVVIQNFRPGVRRAPRARLRRRARGEPRPRLRVALGVRRRRARTHRKGAYDTVIQAYGGFAANQADPDDGEPVFLRQTAADKVTALYAIAGDHRGAVRARARPRAASTSSCRCSTPSCRSCGPTRRATRCCSTPTASLHSSFVAELPAVPVRRRLGHRHADVRRRLRRHVPGVRRRRLRRPAGRDDRSSARKNRDVVAERHGRGATRSAADADHRRGDRPRSRPRTCRAASCCSPAELADDPHALAIGMLEDSRPPGRRAASASPATPRGSRATPADLGRPRPTLGRAHRRDPRRARPRPTGIADARGRRASSRCPAAALGARAVGRPFTRRPDVDHRHRDPVPHARLARRGGYREFSGGARRVLTRASTPMSMLGPSNPSEHHRPEEARMTNVLAHPTLDTARRRSPPRPGLVAAAVAAPPVGPAAPATAGPVRRRRRPRSAPGPRPSGSCGSRRWARRSRSGSSPPAPSGCWPAAARARPSSSGAGAALALGGDGPPRRGRGARRAGRPTSRPRPRPRCSTPTWCSRPSAPRSQVPPDGGGRALLADLVADELGDEGALGVAVQVGRVVRVARRRAERPVVDRRARAVGPGPARPAAGAVRGRGGRRRPRPGRAVSPSRAADADRLLVGGRRHR